MEEEMRFHLAFMSSPAQQRKQPAPESRKNIHHAWPQSIRSATIGSTFVARRAGNQQARNATNINSDTIAKKVAGSAGLTPNSNVFSIRVSANAAPAPQRYSDERQLHSLSDDQP